jgi:hypothetical protein
MVARILAGGEIMRKKRPAKARNSRKRARSNTHSSAKRRKLKLLNSMIGAPASFRFYYVPDSAPVLVEGRLSQIDGDFLMVETNSSWDVFRIDDLYSATISKRDAKNTQKSAGKGEGISYIR